MYKILVISDTHRKISHVIDLIGRITDLNHVIHLGDVVEDVQDLKALYDVPFDYVAGNCDFYNRNVPLHNIIEICGKKFYITHGHQENVKYTLGNLTHIIDEQNVDVVLFGHTHIPILNYYKDGIILNPGSISEPRNQKNPSYAIIQIDAEARIHACLNDYKKVF
jgi:uncharacterized protein